MNRAALNGNRPGTRRADLLAEAAADTDVRVGFRKINAVSLDSIDGMGWADFDTSAAILTGAIHDAFLGDQFAGADLGQLFRFQHQRLQSSGRTKLRADIAVVIAVTVIEIERGLEQPGQPVLRDSRPDHIRRAVTDAEVAGRTGCCEVIDIGRTGRHNRLAAAGQEFPAGFLAQRNTGER